MTSPNIIDRKTRRLLTQAAVLEGVLNGTLAALCTDKLMAELFASAKDLQEEMAKPVELKAWTPAHPRNAS